MRRITFVFRSQNKDRSHLIWVIFPFLLGRLEQGFTVYMSSAMKYISIFHKSAIFFLRYLAEVPDFFEMEEYIEDVIKRKNCLLIERRVVEKSLLGKEAIIVWIVKKLEEKWPIIVWIVKKIEEK